MEHLAMKLEKKLQSSSIPYLKCKDYLVSGESFDLLYNKEYDLLYTIPIPPDLSSYYKSDNYISHGKSQNGTVSTLYNWVRSYALRKKERMVAKYGLEKSILDVGTGTGEFLKLCKERNWNVVGTEPDADARNLAINNGLQVYSELNQVEQESFSVITLWHVLEHIPNLSETIELLKLKLSDQGRLIIAVPNFRSWDANHYKEFWAAYDVPRHLWHFSKKSINRIFRQYDFVVEQILPMKFDSYYVSLLSEKNKTGKPNYLKAFVNGWRSNQIGGKENNYSSLIYVLKRK